MNYLGSILHTCTDCYDGECVWLHSSEIHVYICKGNQPKQVNVEKYILSYKRTRLVLKSTTELKGDRSNP